jgi:hypothetical protein
MARSRLFLRGEPTSLMFGWEGDEERLSELFELLASSCAFAAVSFALYVSVSFRRCIMCFATTIPLDLER